MDYLVPFISGGTIVALTKYASRVKTLDAYSGIIAAFPMGLLSAYFIVEGPKIENYMKDYAIQSLLTIISTIVFLLFLKYRKKDKIESKEIGYATIVAGLFWLLSSFTKLKAEQYF